MSFSSLKWDLYVAYNYSKLNEKHALLLKRKTLQKILQGYKIVQTTIFFIIFFYNLPLLKKP